MNLLFDNKLAEGYKSGSQISRVVTEGWMAANMYCPICGAPVISQYKANRPVADFYCDECRSDYELKSRESKTAHIGQTIADGAYRTMIERITSLRNPNLFVMTYSGGAVNNLLLIPNFFFTPSIIEKRPPLKATARRAGWVGCNIGIGDIPESGRIFIVKNSIQENKAKVIDLYQRSLSLKTERMDLRGWLLDVLRCVDSIPTDSFTLNQVYAYIDDLQKKHPDNSFIKDKIRQQLQLLRDKGFIEFTSRGNYKKIVL